MKISYSYTVLRPELVVRVVVDPLSPTQRVMAALYRAWNAIYEVFLIFLLALSVTIMLHGPRLFL